MCSNAFLQPVRTAAQPTLDARKAKARTKIATPLRKRSLQEFNANVISGGQKRAANIGA